MSEKQQESSLRSNLSVSLAGGLEERSSRANDLSHVFVDIVERDEDINIMAYIKPGLPRSIVQKRIRPALLMACRAVFGEKPREGCFELWWRDQTEIAKRIEDHMGGIKLQVGDLQGEFDAFEIVIHPPESKFYSVEGLEGQFLPKFKRALDVAASRG